MKRWRCKAGGIEVARFALKRNAVAQCEALLEWHHVVYLEKCSLFGTWNWYQTFFRAIVRGMSDEG